MDIFKYLDILRNKMELKKTQKTQKKYVCEYCDYITVNKFDYNRHITRPKHIKIVNGNDLEIEFPQKTPQHICNDCNKELKGPESGG